MQGQGVRSRAIVLATRLDPQRTTLALLAGERVELDEAPRALAIVAEGKRVTILALSPDAGRVLELLDGKHTLEQLERASPGLAAAARTLAARGLVELGLDAAAFEGVAARSTLPSGPSPLAASSSGS